jgi:zinc transporter, ZIP family
MSALELAALGGLAGGTIYLGLPLGRLRARMESTRVLLNAVAVGVLVFLVWDILAHGWEPVDEAVSGGHPAAALGYGMVLLAGLAVGLLGLVWFDQWIAKRGANLASAEPAPATPVVLGWRGSWAHPAGRLAVLIAVGIGMHNFAEGLAIGSSAAVGEVTLAWLLVLGFAAHNGTEGFGIVAPLAAARIRPSWGQLGLLGLIAGGPTVVGTVLGNLTSSPVLSVAFLALAAGSILYVIMELLAVARRFARKFHTSAGLLVGLALGFFTDAVLTAGGV